MYNRTQTACLWALVGLACLASGLGPNGTMFAPVSWPLISICIWLAYTVLKGGEQDRRGVMWGVLSACALASFLANDPSFRSWGDVYFFCGPQMQYCTCGFRWNFAGWYKAIVLWNFVLSAAVGVQRLIIQLGLCGLLPGEEVVTRESFISICWRLIPYWLNNWEQQWGAECSSMMFELPHFAVELVIILPCVQILCSRMQVLAMPSVNAALPPGRDGRPQVVREEYVPNVLRGCWERQPEQRHIWHRIRANKRIIAFSCALCLMALSNALYIPVQLEDLILNHPDAAVMQVAGRLPEWHDAKGLMHIQQGLQDGSVHLGKSFVIEQAAAAAAAAARQQAASALHTLGGSNNNNAGSFALGIPSIANTTVGAAPVKSNAAAHAVPALYGVEAGPWRNNGSWVAGAVAGMVQRVVLYKSEPWQCPDVERLRRNLLKHHEEIVRMQSPAHRATIPLVEVALALMRLSTEKFFVLLSLYVAFLLYRVPPRFAARLISLNARVSSAFARLILYSFPAVCWVYGAGFTFSTVVSVVFWGGPIMQLCEFLRSSVCSVSIKALRPATTAEIERMHGDCAICWCEMTVAPCTTNASSNSSGGGSGSGSSGAAAGAPPEASASAAAAAGKHALQNAATGSDPPVCSEVPVRSSSSRAAAAGCESGGGAAGEPGAGCSVDLMVPPGSPTPLTHGYTLPCGHAYHKACLNQWLQQCHTQSVTPTCPMCQAPLQLHVQWHLLWHWGRPAGAAAAAAGAGGGEAAAGDAANNYLLEHQPRLAELLADMPQILAQENVQLLAEVQDLRHQRQQLVGELQLRQQQLQELAGRQQQMELQGLEMEQQRQQLLQELHLLRRARDRQRQLQQLIGQQQQQQQDDEAAGIAQQPMWMAAGSQTVASQSEGSAPSLAGDVDQIVHEQHWDLAAAGELGDPLNMERFRQLETMLDAFISEQMQAASRAAPNTTPEEGGARRIRMTWKEALLQQKQHRRQQQQVPGQGLVESTAACQVLGQPLTCGAAAGASGAGPSGSRGLSLGLSGGVGCAEQAASGGLSHTLQASSSVQQAQQQPPLPPVSRHTGGAGVPAAAGSQLRLRCATQRQQ